MGNVRKREEPGEWKEKRGVEEVVPATVHKKIEAINGDQIAQGALSIDPAQRCHLHRRSHSSTETEREREERWVYLSE